VSPLLRWTGSLSALGPDERRALDARGGEDGVAQAFQDAVRVLMDQVRRGGDAALRAQVQHFDGVGLESLEVPPTAVRAALDRQAVHVRRALEHAARNLVRVHDAFRPRPSRVEVQPGVVVERRPDALDRVGVYAPGGRAAYPSSVLMGVVPARVAGVREVILCSPPGPSGLPNDGALAAAAISEVDRVFAVGGAGAIAAMAHGTESIPRVDRIVGPGNAWVAEAKTQVAGRVPIDAPAGPSELLVLLDDTADLDAVAGEMLAQAEHDPMTAVVAVALDTQTARRLADRLGARLSWEPRAEIIATALASRGAVLGAASLDEAVAFARAWAPEHLLLVVAEAESVAPRVRCAGTILVGAASSGAFGDYLTGANHVLPTGGMARAWSGLSTLDFVRWTTVQTLTPEGAGHLARDTEVMATAERLPAHAAAARAWSPR
jgi:histidinol dehydrogenase